LFLFHHKTPLVIFINAHGDTVASLLISAAFTLVTLFFVLYYNYLMSVTQTVEIPASRRLTIDVPCEIPTGQVILTFTPAKSGINPKTVGEALIMAAERAADPKRKPISRHFGKHKGIFDGDGVAYQRAIRDEWD
jgi:hypothetical protein